MRKPSEQALVASLRQALRPLASGEGFTGSELAERLGCCSEVMRRVVRTEIAAGRMEVVPLKRVRVNGTPLTIAGYRLRNGKP